MPSLSIFVHTLILIVHTLMSEGSSVLPNGGPKRLPLLNSRIGRVIEHCNQGNTSFP